VPDESAATSALLLGAALASGCGCPKSPATPTPGATAATTETPTNTTPDSNPTQQQPATLPDTPAGTQAQWLIDAVTHTPISDADAQAHFDATFLGLVSPAQLNQTFAGVRTVDVEKIATSQPSSIVFNAHISTASAPQEMQVTLTVDSQGLISGLHFGSAAPPPAPPPAPTSWSGVDDQVKSVAPQVRFLAAKLDNGNGMPIHAIDADTPAPLGSSFKLYVLDALANAIKSGKVTWDQQLTITDALEEHSVRQPPERGRRHEVLGPECRHEDDFDQRQHRGRHVDQSRGTRDSRGDPGFGWHEGALAKHAVPDHA
jgi:hypothetical protein